MCHEPNINLAGLQVPADILAAKAIAHTTNSLTAEILPHRVEDGVDYWFRLEGQMVLHPVHDAEALWSIDWDYIAVE
jgi:hypothetical protein